MYDAVDSVTCWSSDVRPPIRMRHVPPASSTSGCCGDRSPHENCHPTPSVPSHGTRGAMCRHSSTSNPLNSDSWSLTSQTA